MYFGKYEELLARGLLARERAELNEICLVHKLDFKTVELVDQGRKGMKERILITGDHWKMIGKPTELHRGGFLYLAALREVGVISLALVLVLSLLLQGHTLLHSFLAGQSPAAHQSRNSVLGIMIDQDQQQLIALTWPGELHRIDLATGVSSSQLASENLVSAVTSAKNSTTVLLWEWAEDSQIHHCVQINRQENRLVTQEWVFDSQSTPSISVSFAGEFAVLITSEGDVVGWDLSLPTPVEWKFSIGKVGPESRLSSDGRQILVNSREGKSFLCDARTGTGRIELREIRDCCRSTAWSRDGKLLVLGDQAGNVHLFDTETGIRIWHDQLPSGFARSAALSHDGTRLAVGGFDHIIRVWDVTKPSKRPLKIAGKIGVTRCLAFTPRDQTLISGNLGGMIHEWSLDQGTLIRELP